LFGAEDRPVASGDPAGRLAADLATGQTPSVDPAPFRVSRFEDGSPIVIGPEIQRISSLLRFAESQHEVVRFAHRDVLRAVLVALRESRRQGPHAIHPILGIFWVGVYLG